MKNNRLLLNPPFIIEQYNAQSNFCVANQYVAGKKSFSLESLMVDFLNKRIKIMDNAIAKIDTDFPNLA